MARRGIGLESAVFYERGLCSEVQADGVCSDCGLTWKDKSRKCWTCQAKNRQLADAAPCPLIIDPDDESERTLADQTPATRQARIRQEVLENKPRTESELSSVKGTARTTDDLDASQGFNLWRPENAKVDRFQASMLSFVETRT